jgi:hypothetical protein
LLIRVFFIHSSHLRYGLLSICYASLSIPGIYFLNLSTFCITHFMFRSEALQHHQQSATNFYHDKKPKSRWDKYLQSSFLQGRLNILDTLLHMGFDSAGTILHSGVQTCKSAVPSRAPFRCLCGQTLFGAGDEEEEGRGSCYAGGSDEDAGRASESVGFGYHGCGFAGLRGIVRLVY